MNLPLDISSSPQVILELVYKLKIKDVMTKNLITATQDTSLRDIQKLMKNKDITGIPIVDNDRLLGFVTIGDIIKALDESYIEDPAIKHMSTGLVTLDEDMPLSIAISYFNKYDYRRYPILNKDSVLVGLVTAADILKTLLLELNTIVEELEDRMAVQNLSKQEISNEKLLVHLCLPTRRFDFEGAGKASSEFKNALKEINIETSIIRRVAIISYELEMNQVIHSNGGIMDMSVSKGQIRIEAKDTGPGISNVDKALEEGFSTANEWVRSLGFGAGLGLPNVKNSADSFKVDVIQGQETKIVAIVNYS